MRTVKQAKDLILKIVECYNTYGDYTYLEIEECGRYYVDTKLNENYCVGNINFVIQNYSIIYFDSRYEDRYLNHELDEAQGFSIEYGEYIVFMEALQELSNL